MPNTKPLTTQAALDDKLSRAAAKCLVNYGFFMGATAENHPDLRLAHPTPGIKIFMGSMHGALLVGKKYQRRLHILHMSTAEEAELLRKDKPAWVTAEVTPQHLLLNTSAYETIGTLAQAYCIPNKGLIASGYDADLVLVDLETYRPVARTELQTKCGWSPFEG